MKYDFTVNWFGQHAPAWEYALSGFKGKPIRVIELGSYEGQASVWLLDNLLTPDSHLICVDTWKGSEEHSEIDMTEVKKRFDHNVAKASEGKEDSLSVFVGTSADFLLNNQDLQADVIYIDASHRAADVLMDAVLSHPILKPGGVLIFDDYLWSGGLEHRVDTPRAAIDAFMECYGDQYDALLVGVQVMLKKR